MEKLVDFLIKIKERGDELGIISAEANYAGMEIHLPEEVFAQLKALHDWQTELVPRDTYDEYPYERVAFMNDVKVFTLCKAAKEAV